MENIIIAIDGPAGSGKGTLAKALSEKFNLVNIDTGATYRCVALKTLRNNISLDETDKIISAQKARGVDLESGGFVKKVKALLPILIPLLFSAIRRADELADAMDCRCYSGGKGRTRMKILKLSKADYICAIILLLCFLGVVLIGIYL